MLGQAQSLNDALPTPHKSSHGATGCRAHGTGRVLAVLTGGTSCPQPLPFYLDSQPGHVGPDPLPWMYAPPDTPGLSRRL